MIVKAEEKDRKVLAGLAGLLWPGHEPRELEEEISRELGREDGAFFLLWREGEAVGFAQCSLRSDYVEGTKSSPVGYLEGIYLKEPFRGRGLGRALTERCEDWARRRGCSEFASDCGAENTGSLRSRLASGFREAGRIICFVKPLPPREERESDAG